MSRPHRTFLGHARALARRRARVAERKAKNEHPLFAPEELGTLAALGDPGPTILESGERFPDRSEYAKDADRQEAIAAHTARIGARETRHVHEFTRRPKIRRAAKAGQKTMFVVCACGEKRRVRITSSQAQPAQASPPSSASSRASRAAPTPPRACPPR